MMSFLRLVLPVLVVPCWLGAQQPAPSPSPSDSLFQRAAQLVREGKGDAGRALVDSILSTTQEGQPAYGEGLYWRAALASSAAAAERDYKRVIVEYPASPRAEEALLTLAQLELARGDRERALAHLQRLQVEHPGSRHRARAAVWSARTYFEMRDATHACASLAEARASVSADDVELRNQVEYLESRCAEARAVEAPPAPEPKPEVVRGTRDEVRDGKRDEQPRSASFAIQVAAYDTRGEASALVARLVKRGYKARVFGSSKPFRVRVGSYATRAEANAALKKMKAAKLSGFVTEGDAK